MEYLCAFILFFCSVLFYWSLQLTRMHWMQTVRGNFHNTIFIKIITTHKQYCTHQTKLILINEIWEWTMEPKFHIITKIFRTLRTTMKPMLCNFYNRIDFPFNTLKCCASITPSTTALKQQMHCQTYHKNPSNHKSAHNKTKQKRNYKTKMQLVQCAYSMH